MRLSLYVLILSGLLMTGVSSANTSFLPYTKISVKELEQRAVGGRIVNKNKYRKVFDHIRVICWEYNEEDICENFVFAYINHYELGQTHFDIRPISQNSLVVKER